MRRRVIVNTSPLFYLHRVKYLECLERLYGEIIIPDAVVAELEEGKRSGEDVPQVSEYNWIKIKRVTIPAFIKIIPDLGLGEAEVLALGCEEVEPLLIIDDALARKIANLQKFKYTGTAGVLLKAKEEGHLTEIRSILERLKKSGFYLNNKLVTEILIIAGEGEKSGE